MKTEIKIAVVAYDVDLIDLRTQEHRTDRIVLEQSWLKVLNRVDISDRDFIAMSYGQKGYLLQKMHTRRKVSLAVDLEQLYTDCLSNEANSQTFANLEENNHD